MSPVVWRPFTQMKNAVPPLGAISAKDAIIHTAGNKVIIDAVSSWWVINHGHCQEKIVNAIANQAKHLDQVLFANFEHNISKKLISLLSKNLPDSLNHFFFSDNGSTSVEVALKMIIQYWKNLGETQKNIFVSFSESYHGDTVGAMSVSGDSIFTQAYSEFLFKVKRVKQGRYSTDSIEAFTNDFMDTVTSKKDRVAGVILEPLVQGAGGMIVWPKEAVNRIMSICKESKIPLIFDEVMTGFGRTGSLFAFQQLDYNPDVICLSKGLTGGSLPLSLTVASKEIYDSFLSVDKEKMLFHGHSFTGNPISCAAAVASLELFNDRDYESILGKILLVNQTRINNLKSKYKLLDYRLCGSIAAIEVNASKKGYGSKALDFVTQFSIERGVFLRPLGNVIYIMPPYTITEGQLHKVWDVIDDALSQL